MSLHARHNVDGSLPIAVRVAVPRNPMPPSVSSAPRYQLGHRSASQRFQVSPLARMKHAALLYPTAETIRVSGVAVVTYRNSRA